MNFLSADRKKSTFLLSLFFLFMAYTNPVCAGNAKDFQDEMLVDMFPFMEIESGDEVCADYVRKANIHFRDKKFDEGVTLLLQYERDNCNSISKDGQIQNNIGVLYRTGYFVKKNINTAISYYLAGAKAGSTSAQHSLGYIYLFEVDPVDLPQAIKWFDIAARNGDTDALVALGQIYIDEKYDVCDYSKAHNYFIQASKRSNSTAYCYLGIMYYEGLGRKQNEKISKKYFTASAEHGDSEAAFYLSWIYYYSDEDKNYAKSYCWLHIAKKLGYKNKEEITHMSMALQNFLSFEQMEYLETATDSIYKKKIEQF